MKKLLRLPFINGQAVSSLLNQILWSFQKSPISRDLPEKGKNSNLIPARFRNPLAGCSGKRHIGTTAIVSAFLLFWCLSACKDKDELPAPTQTGANTFGCYVDGRKWVPNGKNEAFNKIPAISCGFLDDENVPGKRNNLLMMLVMSNGETIHLFVKDCYKPGRYELNKTTGTHFLTLYPEASYGRYDRNKNENYTTNQRYTGFINLTVLDTADVYVAGTFEFESYSSALKKSIKLTSGRFDVNMAKL